MKVVTCAQAAKKKNPKVKSLVEYLDDLIDDAGKERAKAEKEQAEAEKEEEEDKEVGGAAQEVPPEGQEARQRGRPALRPGPRGRRRAGHRQETADHPQPPGPGQGDAHRQGQAPFRPVLRRRRQVRLRIRGQARRGHDQGHQEGRQGPRQRRAEVESSRRRRRNRRRGRPRRTHRLRHRGVRGDRPETETETETATETETVADGSEATAETVPKSGDATEWTTQLARLSPAIKDALKAGGPTAQEIKAKFSEAQVYARKGQYDPALGFLDEIETILRNAAPKGPRRRATAFRRLTPRRGSRPGSEGSCPTSRPLSRRPATTPPRSAGSPTSSRHRAPIGISKGRARPSTGSRRPSPCCPPNPATGTPSTIASSPPPRTPVRTAGPSPTTAPTSTSFSPRPSTWPTPATSARRTRSSTASRRSSPPADATPG